MKGFRKSLAILFATAVDADRKVTGITLGGEA